MRNVLITGAGIGIGKATAGAFAAQGDRVFVTDILADEARQVAADLAGAGHTATAHTLDVTSTDAVDALVREIEGAHGALDVLVCNAGIAHKIPMTEMSDEKWDHTFDINLKGMMRLARAAGPAMCARGSGAVVCLSSIMGVAYGWDEHVQYSAAKSGVVGFVRGLAVEWARKGVRVNGIAPGYIRTAQALSEQHSLGPAGLEKAAEFIPMGRVGEADDIADVITFLASDKARYMTGQTVTVDGGLLVGRY